MGETKKANLHIHSLSSDGIYSVRKILAAAKKQGVSIVSITDHNEIIGTLKGARLAEKYGLIFFPGVELMFMVKGRVYEILAYFENAKDIAAFYNKYRYNNGFMPMFKNAAEVTKLIRKHNGAVVVPHPFGRKGALRRKRNPGLDFDAIEVVNAFTGERRNRKARKHTDKENSFLRFGAADMHFFISDLSHVYTRLSSRKPMTKETIWQNILGNKNDIKFSPVGRGHRPHMIMFQKPFCSIVYALNYPRLYLSYNYNKRFKHSR